VSEQPMIIRMTTSRRQQRYDHRLRDLIQRTGDLTIAMELGVPRSTARGWLRAAPTAVVSLEVADLTEAELRQEIVKLRRRVEKLAALLRLALALLHTCGFRLSGERLPDGHAKLQILRAVDRACECIPLRTVLPFLRVSPSRFQAWRRRQTEVAVGTAFLQWVRAAPRTDPSVQRYRTGLLPRVRASKRCSGQGCEIGVRGSQRASSRRIRAHGSRRHWLRRRSARCQ